MSFITHLSKRFLNIPVYKGPYVVKTFPTKSKVTDEEFEQTYDEIRNVQESKVDCPSPFHVVWRNNHFYQLKKKEKIICRKLGLHSKEGFEPVVLPNTPHFNSLLWEIKHIIFLRPIKFLNGIPNEKDIGATKLNHFTGEFTIKPIFKVSQERIDGDLKNKIYEGNYLREYMKKLSGIFNLTTRN